MLNFKKALGMIALFLGIGLAVSTSAFKAVDQPATTEHYLFIGTSSADYNDPDMYQLNGTPSNCNGNGLRCEVTATPDDDGKPVISSIVVLSQRQ